MQEDRKEPLPSVDSQRRTTALLLAIVYSEAQNAGGVFHHTDGAHYALAIADDAPTLRHFDKHEARCQHCKRGRRPGGCPNHWRMPSAPRSECEISRANQ